MSKDPFVIKYFYRFLQRKIREEWEAKEKAEQEERKKKEVGFSSFCFFTNKKERKKKSKLSNREEVGRKQWKVQKFE